MNLGTVRIATGCLEPLKTRLNFYNSFTEFTLEKDVTICGRNEARVRHQDRPPQLTRTAVIFMYDYAGILLDDALLDVRDNRSSRHDFEWSRLDKIVEDSGVQ